MQDVTKPPESPFDRKPVAPGRSRVLLAAGAGAALLVSLGAPILDGRPAFAAATTATQTYQPSAVAIANPERGFYRHQGRCDKDDFSETTLRGYRTQNQSTLVMCSFHLTMADGETPNVTGPIRPEQIEQFKAQARVVRQAGAKMILRFLYTVTSSGDAPPDIVNKHMSNLADAIYDNRDVIAVVQAGFVGKYGEGWETDHFGNLGTISDTDWNNRRHVVQIWLTMLPEHQIQVRTIRMKGKMYGYDPLTTQTAYGPTSAARVGHHNDCFLTSASNAKTYGSPASGADPARSVEQDRAFLQADSQFVAVGGETCTLGDPESRTNCGPSTDASGAQILGAVEEMRRYHYSFLNQDHKPQVIAKWQTPTQNCKAEIDRNLGYRFTLKSSTFPTTVTHGAAFPAKIVVENQGWATPYNVRPVFLVLRNVANPEDVTKIALDSTDPRKWYTGATIDQNVQLPANLAAGTYEVLLNLPDRASGLSSRGDYAIQMANAGGLWESTTGFNKLQQTLIVH